MSHSLCFNCKKEVHIEISATVGRHEQCDHCYADIRCCQMCRFYNTKAYNECDEPMANRILEKEKANFCDYYKFKGTNNLEASQNDLLSAANALFKD